MDLLFDLDCYKEIQLQNNEVKMENLLGGLWFMKLVTHLLTL